MAVEQAVSGPDVTELSTDEISAALASGATTSVDLVCAYLNRIGFYDRTGHCLNAVPVLNPEAMAEAEASDERRRRGTPLGPLDGVPFTVKDSFKVRGLTVASGSPAFAELVASSDAATVEQLRGAGAVLIGKTNMPPMAAGGVQPGLYGYARSPYHPAYLTAAYGSGSSNGAGTATAAGFGAFGLAEETLSSGRSPASNNALVAYTPSRGLVSIRGNWPLFPSCDVVVPYARSIADLRLVLDPLLVPDPETAGDFWRTQRAVTLPDVGEVRESILHPEPLHDLAGLRLGVPRMFIGEDPHKANPVTIRPSVRALWDRAALALTGLGAEVVPVDFPVVSNSELDRPEARGLVERGLVDAHWEDTEIGPIMARAWDEFLERNGAPGLSSLAVVDGDLIFPDMPLRVYANAGSAFDYARLVELAKAGVPEWEEMPGLEQSLRGLERARELDFEEWMERLGLDAVVFPANGDVARSDLFTDEAHMEEALRNGVLFSNGNRAIRSLGIPTVNVPMGRMADIGMPVNLTIAGPAYSDGRLMEIARLFEEHGPARPTPPLTPSLPSSSLPRRARIEGAPPRPSVRASVAEADGRLRLDCAIDPGMPSGSDVSSATIEVWADGRILSPVRSADGSWSVSAPLPEHVERLGGSVLLVVRVHAPSVPPGARVEELTLPPRRTGGPTSCGC